MSSAPYLSVVVTARNDDHGGDPLYRMQVFIDSLVAQCDAHDLPAELIIVEWNPPADRPRLADVLRWPIAGSKCDVRIIEVPAELHATLDHAERLPLFQMIAKNVGIRRARGDFVLATNIDVLFDEGLIAYVAARRLVNGHFYRVDRYDVPPAWTRTTQVNGSGGAAGRSCGCTSPRARSIDEPASTTRSAPNRGQRASFGRASAGVRSCRNVRSRFVRGSRKLSGRCLPAATLCSPRGSTGPSGACCSLYGWSCYCSRRP